MDCITSITSIMFTVTHKLKIFEDPNYIVCLLGNNSFYEIKDVVA